MGKIIAGCLGVFLFVWFLVFAAFGIEVATANLVGRGKAHIEIQSPSSRITNYNHFFNLCASVQQAEAGIDSQVKLRKSATESDDISRIDTNIAALEMTRMNGIYQYNADAAKNYTQGQFRDSDLPYKLSDAPYEAGGTKTRCAY